MEKTERTDHLFVTYAHRGASEYCPENTLLSFYTGVYMGANGIETDVRRTKDGVLVLYHDRDLQKLGREGSVADYTLEELYRFPLEKNGLADRIVTAEDFFRLFGFRDLTFAVELKAAGVARDTVDLLRRYGMVEKTVVTSFHFEYIAEAKEYAPELRVGYLKKEITPEDEKDLLAIGAYEVCPSGATVTPEKADRWHRMGFNVRAWGISDTDVMKAVYDAGADGMTVNFPDRLLAYIREKTEN